MRGRFTFTLTLALLGASPLAAAQDAPQPSPPGTPGDAAKPPAKVEEAKVHYRRARELYDENNFRAALVEMQRAFDLSGNPRLLYDLGQIYFQLQDYPGALNAFVKYVASNRGDIPQQRIDDVQRDIEKLKARIGTLRVAVNRPGAQVLVDDIVVGTAPLTDPVYVGAGRHKLMATADGQSSPPKVLDVAGGDTAEVSLAFATTGGPVVGVAPPSDGPVESKGVSAAVVVPWVITSGLAIATIATGIVALNRSSQQSTDLGTPGATRQQLDADRSSTKSMALASDILLGCTLAAATTSVILTVVNRRSNAPEKPQSGQLRVKVGLGRVGLAGSF